MVSADGIDRQNLKTLKLIEKGENDLQLGIQLFGSDPKTIASAVRKLQDRKPDLIDLNCGCSVKKIIKAGAGAYLLRQPKKIGEMIRAIRSETDVPVTLKYRSGWDEHSINYLEVAQVAVESGVSQICLHPRTRSQMFSGRADWELLRILKNRVPCIVIGSGDLFHPADVARMLSTTACDGVMIARGACGNPFIFSQTIELLRGNEPQRITPRLRLITALEQLREALNYKEEKSACLEARKHFCAYAHGIEGASFLRGEVSQAKSVKEYETIINRYLECNDESDS